MRVNILQTEICEATLLNEARNQTLKQKQKVNKHQFNVVILSVDKCYQLGFGPYEDCFSSAHPYGD